MFATKMIAICHSHSIYYADIHDYVIGLFQKWMML